MVSKRFPIDFRVRLIYYIVKGGTMDDLQCVQDTSSGSDLPDLPGNLTFEELHSAQERVKSRREVVAVANDIIAKRDSSKKTKASVYQAEAAKIPTNDLGLPTYIYRPDIIPTDLNTYTPEQRTAILQAASVPIQYDGGIPTFESGAHFWSQFAWEPGDAYIDFQRYVDMPTLDANVTNAISGSVDSKASDRASIQISVRDLNSLAELYPSQNGLSTYERAETLRETAILYCWHQRVKAYDLFIAAAYRKWREQKVYSVEQSHFRIAETIISKANQALMARFEDPDLINEIKSKDLLDMLKTMITVQRESVGLTSAARAGSGDADAPKNASLEVTLRSIAKGAGEESKSFQDDSKIQELLDDPDSLFKAQELIIKMNSR